MSFFDSLTPVSQYQAQAVAKEAVSRSAIPAMPTPQPMQGYAKGGLADANQLIQKAQILKVFENYFKNLGVDVSKGMKELQKQISEGLQLIPFESSVLGYKPLGDATAQIHFFTVGTVKSLADDMQYFYQYLKKQGITTVYDSLPAPITQQMFAKLGAKIEPSDNPKYKFKARI
jgi:hypothetical protein